MKNTLFISLIVLTALPTAVPKMATPDCSANGDGAYEGAQGDDAQVDGLLREVHAILQRVISRLDTLTAIYDAWLESNDGLSAGSESIAGDAAAAVLGNGGR